ncbi:MAG: hypothetical protein Unbinned4944contig1000_15 [Prokaryotic dsDNA virus sp.]|nr:MAG: hypothetical protein Unbinned4944contig1000_15 [Prokaryotic dsDNA virus sp.]|tara:strand:+ start:250 stop:1095 length:846 start_codon:yes stop_codon:yes gene_type:complete
MAWLDEGWIYRAPITIQNHTANNLTGSATPEVIATISPRMGKFWDNVLSTFNDVRITAADGVTLLQFEFSGTPSKANRTATIHIANTDHNVSTLYGSAAANASVTVWIYWGNNTNGLASGVNANVNITTNTAKVGLTSMNAPGSADTTFMLNCYLPDADADYPRHRIRKQVNDETYIYWNLSSCLSTLSQRNEQSRRNEEIAYVKAIIYDQDGSDTTSAMTVLNDICIMDSNMIEMPIKAGTHEKRYVIIMTIGLVDESGRMRVLDQRATLLVDNLGLHPS